jgi:hypothetical protein
MAATDFTVDRQSAVVAAMAEPWPMLDALVGGTPAMRKAATTFLPRFPQEEDESYKARVSTATLFPAFARTCEVMAGKPFAKPITIGEDLPPQIVELLDDVDMFGTDFQPFAAAVFLACMQKGLMGVLVDVPKADGVKTRADERKAGVRPYLTQYPAESILGWRGARNAEGAYLTQLRLLESVSEPDGLWGEKTVQQVRVLTPGAWETWRKVKTESGGEEWALYESGTTSLKKIPFVFFYGLRKGFGVGVSPLLDLAYLNVEHWQSSSDQQTILHVARVPILFAKGFSDADALVVGAAAACRASNADADLSYVEHTGAAIEAGRQSILDLEDRMRQTGAELLVQKPMTTTATQVVSEGEGSKSILQKIAEDFDESLEQCLDLMGEWIGVPTNAEVELYKDFGEGLSTDDANLLMGAASGGHVSSETVFEGLKRRDIVPADAKWDEEAAKIAAQKPKDDPKPKGKKPVE